jgi:hypothetical protein
MATIYSSVVSSRPLPIDVERRPPWNRWFFRLAHYWRYGYLHPDEDLLGVIEAAGDAIRVHAMAARTELRGDAANRATDVLNRLEQELGKTIPDFATMLGLEAEINALYPPELARYRRWIIRERFERVASPGAVQSWRGAQVAAQFAHAAGRGDGDEGAGGSAGGAGAGDDDAGGGAGGDGGGGGSGGGGGGDGASSTGGASPGGGDGGASGMGDQGEVQALLGYVHSSYLLSIAREKAVRDLKRWLLMRFWFFLAGSVLTLAALGGILVLAGTAQYWGLALGLFLVAIAGRMGATTSVIRRMQTAISGNVLARDPILELTALRTGKNEISLALLTSSIFALLLYAFFLTGVPHMLGFQDGIFPRSAMTERGAMSESAPEAPTQDVAAAPTQTPVEASGTNVAATVPDADAEAPDNAAEPDAGANAAAPAAANLAGDTAAASTAAANTAAAAGTAEVSKPTVSAAQAAEDTANRELKLTCGQGVDCNPFDNLATLLGLLNASDFFKLLIWAFIAGFAERFVPDVLDRVVARGRDAPPEGSGALIAAQLGGNNPTGPPAPSPPSPEGSEGEARPAARAARTRRRG